ncbi:MAG: Cytosol non-specific dipeptidase [Promethearchaeota archaeon]|nr:MAG: Cytosol non-specific dipeptidase [Candidatus Lokiarchaeota archaeon]
MGFDVKKLGEPLLFWKYFEEISKIPRCSGNEQQIRVYIENIARSFEYNIKTDEIGNILVYRGRSDDDSSTEGDEKISTRKQTVIFQAHLDMVCEKNKDIIHNFTKESLSLQIVKKGGDKWVTAQGTTLGADNGVGIAYCLTLMNLLSNKKWEYAQLIIKYLFTVQEETGLIGAGNINHALVEADYLINLDSEDDTKFTIGCAGGITTIGRVKLDYIKKDEISNTLVPIQLAIKGLLGGHSGVDINEGRANAIKILSKILWKVNTSYGIYISALNGGNLSNAIPREAEVCFYCDQLYKSDILDLVERIKSEVELGISQIEPGMEILPKPLERSETDMDMLFSNKLGEKLLHILYVMPNGPISIHPKDPNLVYTSTNLASLKMQEGYLEIVTSQRSLHEISKTIMHEKVEALFRLADLGIEIHHKGEYPSWEPDYDSDLLKVAKTTYNTLFQEEPIIQVIHAGLETGILKKQFPSVEMISLGPNIEGGHSPDESLQVKSVRKIWYFLSSLLENLDMLNRK